MHEQLTRYFFYYKPSADSSKLLKYQHVLGSLWKTVTIHVLSMQNMPNLSTTSQQAAVSSRAWSACHGQSLHTLCSAEPPLPQPLYPLTLAGNKFPTLMSHCLIPTIYERAVMGGLAWLYYNLNSQASVAQYERGMIPAEKKISGKLKKHFHDIEAQPHQLLREFQRWEKYHETTFRGNKGPTTIIQYSNSVFSDVLSLVKCE